jgi:hypothetical protein
MQNDRIAAEASRRQAQLRQAAPSRCWDDVAEDQQPLPDYKIVLNPERGVERRERRNGTVALRG